MQPGDTLNDNSYFSTNLRLMVTQEDKITTVQAIKNASPRPRCREATVGRARPPVSLSVRLNWAAE
jgi:hypothetical protein